MGLIIHTKSSRTSKIIVTLIYVCLHEVGRKTGILQNVICRTETIDGDAAQQSPSLKNWPQTADWPTVVPKRLKPAKNKLSWYDLTSFSKQVSENSITSVSGHGLHYIFKTCQFVTGTSMVRQLHNFFQSNFWCVFYVWAKCGTDGRSRSVLRTNKGRKARQRLRRPWRLCDEEAKKPYDFSSWQRGWIKQPRKVEHTVSPEGVKLQPVWNKH